MKLTLKQKRFVDEYLVDLNATEAALRAGYSKRTAYSIGNENLKKPEVQKEIQERMKDRQERTEIAQDKVLKELAHIAYDDIRNYLKFWTDEEGKIQVELKSSDEIDTRNIYEIQLDNGKTQMQAISERQCADSAWPTPRALQRQTQLRRRYKYKHEG